MASYNTNSKNDFRSRVFRMVSVGVVDEPINQAYDIISTGALIANLVGNILYTYESIRETWGALLLTDEAVTVLFFAVDYLLRIYTAKELYPEKSEGKALLAYMTSFSGIVDLLSFLPYYLPIFFPAGVAAFRMFRVIRILRLFRINAYYDSLNVITDVIKSKKQQLLSSVFIIAVFMVATSLCMYSLEHDAQPDVFQNAFSGIWWSASTLLTVGYGDIYPVTTLGRFLSIIITFLGVGIVAIPTGIISAGFVEQYAKIHRLGESDGESSIRFLSIELSRSDAWCGKMVKDIQLPQDLIIATIVRDGKPLTVKGRTLLCAGDILLITSD